MKDWLSRRAFLKGAACLAGTVGAMGLVPRRQALALSTDNTILVTADVAEEMAASLSGSLFQGRTLDCESALKYYDPSGYARGYEVNFALEGSDAGYVIFDKEAEGFVSEFSFDGNCKGPLKTSLEAMPSTMSTQELPVLYKTGPLEYLAINPYSGQAVDGFGEEATAPTDSVSPLLEPDKIPNDWNDIYISPDKYYQIYTPSSEQYVYPYTAIPEATLESICGQWGCGASACLTVCSTYMKYSDPYSAYNALCAKSSIGTYYSSDKPGITLHRSTRDKCVNTIVDYLGQNGVAVAPQMPPTNSRDAIWSLVSSACGRNKASFIGGVMTNGYIESGHAFASVGTSTVRNTANGWTGRFLMIADGWYAQYRYFNLDQPLVTSLYFSSFL